MPGGIAVFLSELGKGLSGKGHRVLVLAREMPGAEKFDQTQPYAVARCRFSKYLSSLSLGWHVLKQIIKERPDVLFVGHAMATRGIFILLLSRCFRIPYVVLIHAGHIPIGYVNRINDVSSRFFLKNARLLLANSAFTQKQLNENGFLEKTIKILMPGVDVSFFSPAKDLTAVERIRLRYAATNESLIANVGRLVPKKNQKRIIKVIADLSKQGVRAKCVIAGEGPERERLRQCIEEHGIASQVSMIGNAGREAVRDLYQAVDLVLLPSIIVNDDHESFGIVALEASACGKPVIVGKQGGQGDAVVFGKTGVTVDADDEKDIARAIAFLIENKDAARRMGEAGRQHVLANFTWEHVTDRAEEIFYGVIHGSK